MRLGADVFPWVQCTDYVADYVFKLNVQKFKMADPIWQIKIQKKFYKDEIWYSGVFGVADYESELET